MVTVITPGPDRHRRRESPRPPTCSSRPIRDEMRRRVRTTSLDDVEIVIAELGTWAGAIGAAIHGADSAAGSTRDHGADDGPRAARPRRSGRGGPDPDRGRADRRGGDSTGHPDGRPCPPRPTLRSSRPASSTSTSTAGAATTRWAARDALDGMAAHLLRHGVTSFLPTAVTAPLPALARVRGAGPRVDAGGARRTGRSRWGSTSRARSSRRLGAARTIRRTSASRPTSPPRTSSRSSTASA